MWAPHDCAGWVIKAMVDYILVVFLYRVTSATTGVKLYSYCSKPSSFLLLNTKEDILKNVANQIVDGP